MDEVPDDGFDPVKKVGLLSRNVWIMMHRGILQWVSWLVQAWVPLPPAFKIWCKHRLLGQPSWNDTPSRLADPLLASDCSDLSDALPDQQPDYDVLVFTGINGARTAASEQDRWHAADRGGARIHLVDGRTICGMNPSDGARGRLCDSVRRYDLTTLVPDTGAGAAEGSTGEDLGYRLEEWVDRVSACAEEQGMVEPFCYVDEPLRLAHALELKRRFHWKVGFELKPERQTPASSGQMPHRPPKRCLLDCDLLLSWDEQEAFKVHGHAGKALTLTQAPAMPPAAADAPTPILRFGANGPGPTPGHAGQVFQNTFWERLDPVIRSLYPRASIVIPTHNGLHFTRSALRSILRNTSWPNYEVIVVDNDSRDGTRAMLSQTAARHAFVRVLLADTNMGFAGAVNRGIRAATGHYIVVLNNDTLVTHGWLSRLIRHLESDPAVAMVGPVTNSTCNEAEITVDYVTEHELAAFAARRARQYKGQTLALSLLALFCVVMRRELFDEIGLLDERFQVGTFEDDDLALRVRNRGQELRCAEDVFVHHFGKGTFRLMSEPEYQRLFDANRRQFEDKWNIRWRPQRRRD